MTEIFEWHKRKIAAARREEREKVVLYIKNKVTSTWAVQPDLDHEIDVAMVAYLSGEEDK